MNIITQRRTSRREWIRNSAAATLALGLWPGSLRADRARPSGSFRFVVVNDTHCVSPECLQYLEGAVAQMKREEPEFCLHGGDLTDKAELPYFESVKALFGVLPGPFYPVIGNHDYATQKDRSAYERVFPRRLNYHFQHGGWQFLCLDSSDGQRYEKTAIQPATMQWLSAQLPRLEPRQPTVILTHFPLGPDVQYRPSNADALLELFLDFNLQAVFSGHFHGFTEREAAGVVLTTNRCCALKRANHDGTKAKGYFLCSAEDGRLHRSFVEWKG